MITSTQYGVSFALDVFENTFEGTRLKSIYTMDHQPSAIYYNKTMLFISTSHPSTLIYVLDALLLKRIAVLTP